MTQFLAGDATANLKATILLSQATGFDDKNP